MQTEEIDFVFVQIRENTPQWEVRIEGKVFATVTERVVSTPPYVVRFENGREVQCDSRDAVIETLTTEFKS